MRHFPVTLLWLMIASFCLANTAHASVVSIKDNVCANLDANLDAMLDVAQNTNTPVMDEAGMTAKIALRPASMDWRIAVITINDAEARPFAEIRLGKGCVVMQSRQIARNADGDITAIHDLGPDLEKIVQTTLVNPEQAFAPKPTDANPQIALIDTGVNYTLPAFWPHIAVDKSGKLIGYDFWDNDPWPYDSDPRRTPFYPTHHGSTVFSVLADEAPEAMISVYRFPALEMCRFTELLAHIAGTSARLVNLSMGSNDPEDWLCFAEAAQAMPQFLFVVSAGNNGRNIDLQPVYPASLALANIVVVSSSDNFGVLGVGSNFGPEHVDVLVPGERVSIIDHRGAKAKTGGTSYAAPRVTALLARYLAKNPDATPVQMIDFLRNRAIGTADPLSKFGWIPDPSDDFGF